MLEWCREHRAILLAVWVLAIFDPSFYADDWDGDGYDDDTGEWIDDTGSDYSDYDSSYDYGYDDTGSSGDDYQDSTTDSDDDGIIDADETNGFEVYVTYTDTYSETIYDDSSGESYEESFDYEYSVFETVYTDPNNADSDFDLLDDGYERDMGFNPTDSSDGNADTDSDGLTNGEEFVLGTDYLNPDSDFDTYEDGMESLVMLTDPMDENSPEIEVPADDPENGAGTAGNSETGGSGNSADDIPDTGADDGNAGESVDSPPPVTTDFLTAWKRFFGVDETDPAAMEGDLDNDGLSNAEEFALRTSPLLADSDRDGLDDLTEVRGREVVTYAYTVEASDEVYENQTFSYTDADTGESYSWEEPVQVIPAIPIHTSDPLRSDGDDDGYSDAWEWQYRMNPLDPADLVVYSDTDLPEEFAFQHPMEPSGDEDEDGITNGAEFVYRTDPFSADGDGDGISDLNEIEGFVRLFESGYWSTYTDGTYDEATGEYTSYDIDYWVETVGTETYYLNPSSTDSDSDGLPDGVELEAGWDPNNPANGLADHDGDGLTFGEEYQFGSSDLQLDTDRDGLSDWQEIRELNPLLELLGFDLFDPADRRDGQADFDHDGLSNADEYALLRSDMFSSDTDRDGHDDLSEILAGTDLLDPSDPLDESEGGTGIGTMLAIHQLRGASMFDFFSADTEFESYGERVRPDEFEESTPKPFTRVSDDGDVTPTGAMFEFQAVGGISLFRGSYRDETQSLGDPPAYRGFGKSNPGVPLSEGLWENNYVEAGPAEEGSDDGTEWELPAASIKQRIHGEVDGYLAGSWIRVDGVPDYWGGYYNLQGSGNGIVPETRDHQRYRFSAVISPGELPPSENEEHAYLIKETRHQLGTTNEESKRWWLKVKFEAGAMIGTMKLEPYWEDADKPSLGVVTVEDDTLLDVSSKGETGFLGAVTAAVGILLPVDLILDNENKPYDPNSEALGVSNYVTTNGLPSDSPFDGTCDDPENFRLQARLLDETKNSVDVKLEVVREGATVLTKNYTLDKKDGDIVRGEFLRLVSDDIDDTASGGKEDNDPKDQTILVKLGDTITVSFALQGDERVEQEIDVGRAATEDNNDTSHKKHDTRKVKVRFTVFDLSASNETPSLPKPKLKSLVEKANAAFAQSGIIVEDVSSGESYGVEPPEEFNEEVIDPEKPNIRNHFTHILGVELGSPDQQALIPYLDDDPNTIDVFIVKRFGYQSMPVQIDPLSPPLPGQFFHGNATAVPAIKGKGKQKNFIIMSATQLQLADFPFRLPHEIMHILLNDGHRVKKGEKLPFGQHPPPLDLPTALFYPTTSPKNEVEGTKRIGPNPKAETSVGNDDTKTIRKNAEKLPQ